MDLLSEKTSRRRFVRTATIVTTGTALAACSAPAPTAMPKATKVTAEVTDAATPVPEATAPPTPIPPTPTPTVVPPTKTPTPDSADLLKDIHWLGHASFRLTGEKVIYIDPWQLQAAAPPLADIILITHDHYDHCSADDVAKIRGPQTTVLASGGCAKALGGEVQVITPGQKLTVQGVTIETVHAYNLDKQYHPKKNGWVGYIVTLNGLRIYHAGDTDDTPEVDAVKADVALLPVGGEYTMDAEQAAAAANKTGPRIAVPMHWGTIVGSQADAEHFVTACQVPAVIMKTEE